MFDTLNTAELEAKIGYSFKDRSLLEEALTHSSYANEHGGIKKHKCNERLEFLGDAVLSSITAEYLFRKYFDHPEGDLTRMRADMVCEKSLAEIAQKLNLGEHLQLGKGEELSGGRNRPSILADAVESVIAACFLDGGMAPAEEFIRKFVLCNVPVTTMKNADYKTALQELVQQKKNQQLTYKLVGESGPDHDKQFVVELTLNEAVVGKGVGTSKKRAEQDAARVALETLFPNK